MRRWSAAPLRGGEPRVQIEHLRGMRDYPVVPCDIGGVGEVDSPEINGWLTAASVNVGIAVLVEVALEEFDELDDFSRSGHRRLTVRW